MSLHSNTSCNWWLILKVFSSDGMCSLKLLYILTITVFSDVVRSLQRLIKQSSSLGWFSNFQRLLRSIAVNEFSRRTESSSEGLYTRFVSLIFLIFLAFALVLDIKRQMLCYILPWWNTTWISFREQSFKFLDPQITRVSFSLPFCDAGRVTLHRCQISDLLLVLPSN